MDVSLEIKQGEICGIVGRNGSGKTVLFKCICGFLKPTSGKILVRNQENRKGY
nr:ATP-binding cassette domain-containing protein [Anaerosacchariphilus polymeriproducens]